MTHLINAGLNMTTFPGVNLFSTLSSWADRAHQRKDLAKLGYSALEDIGLNVKTAQKEARKPFWMR